MNILFVTQNTQDAGLIRDELSRFIPDLNLEVSSHIREAIEWSSVPGRFSAVLLDPALPDGDPLALIRVLRTNDVPIAIIGLAGPSDLQWIARVMGAGADDYIIRRKGFVATLPETLRRARARHDTGVEDILPRLVHATQPAGDSGNTAAQPKRGGREGTGATSFLLRDVPDAALLPGREPHGQEEYSSAADRRQETIPSNSRTLDPALVKLQEEYSAARSAWETERRALEESVAGTAERLHIAEEELLQARDGLKALESRLTREAEETQSERQRWEHWRTALKQRLAAVEQCRAALEYAVLQENARQEQMARQYSEYALEIDNIRRELEEERRLAAEEKSRLQDSLQEAEARLVKLAEQHAIEKEQWESVRLDLEKQCRDLLARAAEFEDVRGALERQCREALAQEQQARADLQNAAAIEHDLRSAIARQAEEGTQWIITRNELEQRRKLLEDELAAAARKQGVLIETQEQYRVRWETANAELEELRSGIASIHALAREAADLYQVFLKKLGNLENTSTPSAAGDAGPLGFPGRA